ncbi:MAG: carboxypeptidase regulatory-like domain-containing protein [Planctomycetota bacterium]|nr:MAG: carboxypeptidase regulatory-like domain-containing protein [Planctomycetota bacterium]
MNDANLPPEAEDRRHPVDPEVERAVDGILQSIQDFHQFLEQTELEEKRRKRRFAILRGMALAAGFLLCIGIVWWQTQPGASTEGETETEVQRPPGPEVESPNPDPPTDPRNLRQDAELPAPQAMVDLDFIWKSPSGKRLGIFQIQDPTITQKIVANQTPWPASGSWLLLEPSSLSDRREIKFQWREPAPADDSRWQLMEEETVLWEGSWEEIKAASGSSIELTVQAQRWIRGRVVDQNGDPLAGAYVQAFLAEEWADMQSNAKRRLRPTLAFALSGPDGSFEVPAAADSPAILTMAPGRRSELAMLVESNSDSLEIQLPESPGPWLTVRFEDGRPATGMLVEFGPNPDPQRTDLATRLSLQLNLGLRLHKFLGYTDAAGQLRLDGLPPGRFAVRFHGTGREPVPGILFWGHPGPSALDLPVRGEVLTAAGEHQRVKGPQILFSERPAGEEILLPLQATRYQVHLQNDAGMGLGNHPVSLQWRKGLPGWSLTTTDAAGRFAFLGSPATEYRLKVQSPETWEYPIRMLTTPAAGEDPVLPVTLQAQRSLPLQVHWNGKALQRGRWSLDPATDRWQALQAESEAGAFTIRLPASATRFWIGGPPRDWQQCLQQPLHWFPTQIDIDPTSIATEFKRPLNLQHGRLLVLKVRYRDQQQLSSPKEVLPELWLIQNGRDSGRWPLDAQADPGRPSTIQIIRDADDRPWIWLANRKPLDPESAYQAVVKFEFLPGFQTTFEIAPGQGTVERTIHIP